MNSVPGTHRIDLDLAEFDRLTELRGWSTDAERARALGVATSTMSRIRNGVDSPGAKFVDRCLTVLQVPYGALFSAGTSEPVEVG